MGQRGMGLAQHGAHPPAIQQSALHTTAKVRKSPDWMPKHAPVGMADAPGRESIMI
jgi:hypothetical protein